MLCIFFCLLPTLYLVPKLYGKIEPLLGMSPRTPETAAPALSGKTLAGCAVAFVCAVAAEMLATSGLELIDWEASWAESGTSFAVGMIVAAVLALAVLVVMKKKAEAK